MEKRNKIIIAILIFLTLIVIGLCLFAVKHNHIKDNDANKFRNEYMELNDKTNEALDKLYPNVVISENNTVKYLSTSAAVEMLKTGTGLIYFGYNSCPWCRTLVTPLVEVGIEKNEPIYYVDIKDIRSNFEINDNKLTVIKKGSDDYYQILKRLDEYLEEFYLEDEEGNRYDTLEKRLYAPTLVAVNNGVITGVHEGTVDTQETGYDKLSSEQTTELKKIIADLIASRVQGNSCIKGNC